LFWLARLEYQKNPEIVVKAEKNLLNALRIYRKLGANHIANWIDGCFNARTVVLDILNVPLASDDTLDDLKRKLDLTI
jgi:hypothetical protein